MAVLGLVVWSVVLRMLLLLLLLHLLNVVGLLSIRCGAIRLLLAILLLRIDGLGVISRIIRLLLLLIIVVLRLGRIIWLDLLLVSLGVIRRCGWWRTGVLVMSSARPAEDGLVGNAALVCRGTDRAVHPGRRRRRRR